jgi:hypothetical protein
LAYCRDVLSGNTDTDTYDVEQVHVIQGGQPLVDASDFFQLVARQRKRHPAQLVDGFCSRFLGPEHAAALSALALQKSVLPFDVCGRALDQLAESHECGVLRKQALQFRSSSAWGWLTRELAQLTDQGAVPSLALTNAASPATVTAASGSAVTDDAATAAGYEPVSWAEAASERGLGERLTRPVWSAEAEQGLPKLGTKTDAKYVWAASEVEFIKKGVDMADIERVLEQGRIALNHPQPAVLSPATTTLLPFLLVRFTTHYDSRHLPLLVSVLAPSANSTGSQRNSHQMD